MPTVAEKVQLSHLMESEAVGIQKSQAMLPMLADPQLRQQVEACMQTGKVHLGALLTFSKEHNLIPAEGAKA